LSVQVVRERDRHIQPFFASGHTAHRAGAMPPFVRFAPEFKYKR
jgi:hypothetical protein